MKIGVIAGTPVDTQMGVDYLTNLGEYEPIYLPAFPVPRDCHIFQMSEYGEKKKAMKALFEKGLSMGAQAFFVYCNSLSAAFDYNALAEEMGTFAVTPLNAYSKVAKDYDCIGLISANNQATAGIEKTITAANPKAYVNGLGILQLVEAIEEKRDPKEIVSAFHLEDLIEFFKKNKAQCLILGCTHFPYIKEALEGKGLPIVDPAAIMVEILQNRSKMKGFR